MSKRDEVLELMTAAGWRVHGYQIDQAVNDWMETNLEVDRMEMWIEVGCYDAASAFFLDNAGIEPRETLIYDDCGRNLASRFASREIRLEAVIASIEAHA
jgi:hypothetical protein